MIHRWVRTTLPVLIICKFTHLHFILMFLSSRKISLPFLLIFLLLVIQSCDSKRIYEENKRIEKSIWNSKDKATFKVTITDILTKYNFYFNLRNGGDYQYSNIYLFLKTVFPDGRIARDTIECQLADYDGKWLGSGISNVKFNRFLFQKNVRFPQKGQYIFEVEQAMRVKDLKGITDIGIRLEKQ
jgi:gliding motility-associated lipoprotein GldH